MYTILSTYPRKSSGNVGDKLITEAAIDILMKEKKEEDFLILFREEDLNDYLEDVNNSRAVIMPGFAIREPMYPDTYRLVNDLTKLSVPLIPLGAGSKIQPGRKVRYSKDTIDFLRYVSKQVDYFSCREYETCKVLNSIGVNNTIMVGDCGWYDLESMKKGMLRPGKIQQLVFTTPHNPAYTAQALDIINVLATLFPYSKKHCSLQSKVTKWNQHESLIAEYAETQNFIIHRTSHDLAGIDFYEKCDLHVGYRCHGHIAFLRKRIPSVLLHEDSRGVGFTYTLGFGGFDAFVEPSNRYIEYLITYYEKFRKYTINKRKQSFQFPLTLSSTNAMVDSSVPAKIQRLLEEELENNFVRFAGISNVIDETYHQMCKFLDTVP